MCDENKTNGDITEQFEIDMRKLSKGANATRGGGDGANRLTVEQRINEGAVLHLGQTNSRARWRRVYAVVGGRRGDWQGRGDVGELENNRDAQSWDVTKSTAKDAPR